MPLANSFLKSPDEFENEARFPLDVYFCEKCTLVQLLDVIAPEVLFRDYIYTTGTSSTMTLHSRHYAETVAKLAGFQKEDLVVEIAGNDGTLLNCFRRYDVRTLGIEPAENIARIAKEKGIETITEFFNSERAEQILESHGPARTVIANNVLAHVDDTCDFLTGCRKLCSDRGFIVVEVPYLRELLHRLEYDTVYHEHLCYFSVTTLMRLCESAGLGVFRVDLVPVHGGSLRMYASPGSAHAKPVVEFSEQEEQQGLRDFRTYESFAGAVQENRRSLRNMLETIRNKGKTIAAYGAPAKGNTLLNYCGIGPETVSFTVDRSPLKVGMFTPGMHIPVRDTSELLEKQPDFVLLLAWNLAEEIIEYQKEYRNRGGHFILPIPAPEVV